VSPRAILVPTIFVVALIVLAVLGAVGAQAGGAGLLKPTVRVAFWGALAMAVTAAVGALVGHAV
jgi:VIT1/CCC1 family predicted Fe2+/Mn2+ transporter